MVDGAELEGMRRGKGDGLTIYSHGLFIVADAAQGGLPSPTYLLLSDCTSQQSVTHGRFLPASARRAKPL